MMRRHASDVGRSGAARGGDEAAAEVAPGRADVAFRAARVGQALEGAQKAGMHLLVKICFKHSHHLKHHEAWSSPFGLRKSVRLHNARRKLSCTCPIDTNDHSISTDAAGGVQTRAAMRAC